MTHLPKVKSMFVLLQPYLHGLKSLKLAPKNLVLLVGHKSLIAAADVSASTFSA